MTLSSTFTAGLEAKLQQLREEGVYKRLNYLESPQGARVQMEGRGEVIILSSNNYLGLSNEPAVVEAGVEGLEQFGAGTGSVRFICGTFTIHRDLEEALARFVGTEASMSYVSAWNANEGLTATVVEEGDFVVSDALNHASTIDSIRLAKAITKCQTAVYKHADLDDLRAKLVAASGAKRRLVWSDGVFSLEGSIAPLPDLLQICRDHDAVRIIEAGFSPLAGETPIIPIIVGETSAAIQMSNRLLDEGVFVTGFGFPVVPQGQARIRCQISAAHTRADLDEAVAAFVRVGKRLGLI